MGIVLFKFQTENVPFYWWRCVLLILPAVLTAAAGYVINDIFDVVTDNVNKPERTTVGRTITRREAWLLYVALVVLSLIVAYFFNLRYVIINSSITILLGLYAYKFKGLPLIGNLLVASCSAAVIACCLMLASFDLKGGVVNFIGYIIFAFFTSLIREIVKDLQDMEGDKVAGYNTYPLLAGEKGAKILVFSLLTIQILLCGLYTVVIWGIGLKVSAIIMGLVTIGLLYFINHLSRAKTKDDYRFSSQLMKYIMVAGVINLLFN